MAQCPIGQIAKIIFNDGRQSYPQRLSREQRRQMQMYIEYETLCCPMRNNLWWSDNFTIGRTLTITVKLIRCPFTRRREIKLPVGGAVLWGNKRFKAGVLPKPIDPSL